MLPRFVRLLALLSLPATTAGQTVPAGKWHTYGRDPGGSRYPPLTDINTGNVAGLTVAWTFNTDEAGIVPGPDAHPHSKPPRWSWTA